MFRITALLLVAMAFISVSFAQNIGDYIGDESAMYAETKQVNQFFRRFNGEEDVKGERYYPKDSEYRSYKLRKKYLPILFDMESGWVKPELREEFIEHVNGKKESLFLDFHGGEWFADLKTLFYYQGVERELTLYLELQQEKVGSKWVISHVFFPPLEVGIT